MNVRFRGWLSASRMILDGLLLSLGVLVYTLGLCRLLIRINGRSPKVLMYHACDDHETDFTRGLAINTTPAQFAAHLEFLVRHYRVVPLTDLVDARSAERQVAITFDDGFHSVHQHAWPLLREKRLPATCYITTDVVGNTCLIWLNELNWFLHCHPSASRSLISHRLGLEPGGSVGALIAALIERFDPPMIRELLGELRSSLGVDPRALSQESRVHLDWPQIAEMASHGIDFGNHTASHPPLANLPLAACEEEIQARRNGSGSPAGSGLDPGLSRSAAGRMRSGTWPSGLGIVAFWRSRVSIPPSIPPGSAGSR